MSASGTPPTAIQTVVVCGSLHFDVVVNAPHLPSVDETVIGSSVSYVCGGKGGNQAVAASLNGAHTAFLGCIGNDENGSQLAENLRHNQVDCSGLQQSSGASGMSVAVVDSHGNYGAVVVSASNLQIDIKALAFPESVGMLVLQNEVPDSVNVELARRANSLHKPVMLNAAPFRPLPAEFESLIDILVLNRVEAAEFFSTGLQSVQDVKTALMTTSSTIDTIIVTLGADGLVFRGPDGHVHYKPAYPVNVVSSHGAGDMFCGALASRCVAGAGIDDALSHAMAAAACYVGAGLAQRAALDTTALDRLISDII